MSELWSRLGFLAFALIIYRLGTHIPIPGINPEQVAALFQQSQGTILQYFNLFSGGALERMSIFALSVVPYISSAIVMQLFSNSLPYLPELKKMDKLDVTKLHNIQDMELSYLHWSNLQH